jgi:hypothetical protein
MAAPEGTFHKIQVHALRATIIFARMKSVGFIKYIKGRLGTDRVNFFF